MAGGAEAAASKDALESLCGTYWYPLYAYVRRRGFDSEDARDLTQDFFATLLAKNLFAEADRERGKFRSFLLGSLNHFLANEWDKRRALKRGGGATFLSLDAQDAEDRYLLEPMDELTPERLFDRRWAETLLEIVFARLRGEYEAAGHAARFDECKPWLMGDKADCSYEAAAARLGIGEEGVRSAVHRLRRRFRELMRAEIAHTVCDAGEIDDEIRALFQALSG
jgi:DNA-directed RNA polymerase specialized sigma24 family protein